MGVYIKGMKMPTRCGECPLSLYSHSPCWKNGGALDWEHRPNWCPLVPVPPHGRLIDADILASMCDAPNWCVWLTEIYDAPTIIEAEERTEFFTQGHLHLGYAEED